MANDRKNKYCCQLAEKRFLSSTRGNPYQCYNVRLLLSEEQRSRNENNGKKQENIGEILR